MESYLLLSDGTSFNGNLSGEISTRPFEVVVNNSMFGFTEIITNPIFRDKGMVFSYPLVGNCGISLVDTNAKKPTPAALILSEISEVASNFRSDYTMVNYLEANKIPFLYNVDVRKLTRYLRKTGKINGLFCQQPLAPLLETLKQYEGRYPHCTDVETFGEGARKVAMLDLGVPTSIIHTMAENGCTVRVFPPFANINSIVEFCPDEIYVSDGPGNPTEYTEIVASLCALNIPMYGVGLGHLAIAHVCGQTLEPLKFEHCNSNQMIHDVFNNKFFTASQNNVYAISENTNEIVTHRLATDGRIVGLKYKDRPITTVAFC